MNKNTLFRCWETAALVAVCIFLCLCTWAQGRQESVSSELVRLHVIAHSDDESEQALKLRVRDAVLEYISPELEGAESPDEANEIIRSHLSGIASAAQAVSDGREVRVTLGNEKYPTRVYDRFTIPAGEYRSLRVIIGDGNGHNWWCIVFPPVCLGAVSEEQLQSVMSPSDYELIQGESYELRFRVIELWGELKEKLIVNIEE